MVLPLFPLGGTVAYMPYSKHELSIFEPRYRQLYNDILVSGARRFVVTSVHPDGDRFAEVGVVLYLTDLRDVSEETSDQVKYVCDHEVIGRVRIRRVLNPSAWEEASTYLRVETEPLEDEGGESSDAEGEEEEEEVMGVLREVAELQKELDVAQITPDIAKHVNASRAKSGGLWSLIMLWTEYYDYLVAERRAILDEDMHRTYWANVEDGEALEADYYERGSTTDWDDEEDDDDDFEEDEDDEEVEEEQIFVEDMTPQVQAEIKSMYSQFEEEKESLLTEQAELVQLALQSTSHHERLALMREAFLAERRRLAAKVAVRSAVLESRGNATGGAGRRLS